MSRTGVEAKLPWQKVPKIVRQEVETALGAPVKRAARIWGGYSPAPTFRLALADGRRAFFKATNGDSNAFSTQALYAEERVYQELGTLLADWMPRYYATINHGDWHGLVLEDLGPKSVPPWTPQLARGIAYALADFHRATLGHELPEWIPHNRHINPDGNWQKVVEDTNNFERLAHLAGDAAPAAQVWLQMSSPLIEEFLNRPILTQAPFALLHGDLRSDNLRFRKGKLALFDWPAIMIGRAEWDFVAFAQTVTVEGGVVPESVLAWYAEKFPVDDTAVDSAVASVFAFFASRAWREEIPGLPRVRRFQRQQLAVMAQWAARRWDLPAPMWADALLR